MRRFVFVFVFVFACGGTPPPASTVEVHEEEAAPIERACFTGTADNGVCEIFSAALEPLGPLASHCRDAGGQWLDACPSEGRVGTCSGEGRRAIYYGVGLGIDALQHACEAEGHAFAP